MITIELFGIPSIRAGTRRWTTEARTLGAAISALAAEFPKLDGSLIAGEPARLVPYYRISLNGERFLTDPETPLDDDDILILLSADVGG